MLVGYAVENFTSFDDVQKFSMQSGKGRLKTEHLYKARGLSLLRFSGIYGSNASGKSNLVNSMKFAQTTILRGLPKGFINSYNRTKESNSEKQSMFNFEIVVAGKIYTYGFTVLLNKSSIRSEWLYDTSFKGKSIVIFKRDLDEKLYEIGRCLQKSKAYERLKIYFDDAKDLDTVLFLREMNRNKSEIYRQDDKLSVFRDVFRWFRDSLSINYPEEPISNYSLFTMPNRLPEVLEIIRHFGQGITNFEVVDADKDEYSSRIPADVLEEFQGEVETQILKAEKEGQTIVPVSGMVRGKDMLYIIEVDEHMKLRIKTIVFTHGNAGIYDISEESDGMRRILDLIEILFSSNSGKVYVIDEIDRSLHPLLTKEFVDYYIKNLDNRDVQLIVTTHESRLLDLNILRRDEIWFSDKGEDGNSKLYSLEEYNERFDRQIGDAYLKGRYRAIPTFGRELCDTDN